MIKIYVFNDKEVSFLKALVKSANEGFLKRQVEVKLDGAAEPSKGYVAIALYPDQREWLDSVLSVYFTDCFKGNRVAVDVYSELKRR